MLFVNYIYNLKIQIFSYTILKIIIFYMWILNVNCEKLNPKYIVAKENEFKEAYDLLEELTSENTVNLTKTITTPSTPEIGEYWLRKMGNIRDDLLNIQAVIVKDEEVEGACNHGHQKSKRRFLMCAGSILNRNRVLTTASCVQEAIQIRHNIQAPLAVVIAPLKSTIQVIRVAEYRIHPNHNTNPYSNDHIKHNLAILSLACRISSANYFKIDLPTLPMTHICAEENCIITVYRKSAYINVIYQIPAPQIPFSDRRRRSITDKSKQKFQEFNRKLKTNIFYDNSNLDYLTNYSFHGNSKRSSDGLKNCPQTGAAVMINKTQVAIVALSCDDRQNNGVLLYSDLYYNRDWIHTILNDWNKSHNETDQLPMGPNKTHSARNCGNCVFNFYISVGCKAKGNCPKSINSQSKISHNTRQVSNQEFKEAWSQAEKTPWNRRSEINDIQGPLMLTTDQCPNNSPKCLQLSDMKRIHTRNSIFVPRINDLNVVTENSTRFVINPIIDNNSHTNVNMDTRFNNNNINNLRNRTWILRRPTRLPQSNLYRKNFNNQKFIDENRSNWLRRRHANGYVNPNINRKNVKVHNFKLPN